MFQFVFLYIKAQGGYNQEGIYIYIYIVDIRHQTLYRTLMLSLKLKKHLAYPITQYAI